MIREGTAPRSLCARGGHVLVCVVSKREAFPTRTGRHGHHIVPNPHEGGTDLTCRQAFPARTRRHGVQGVLPLDRQRISRAHTEARD